MVAHIPEILGQGDSCNKDSTLQDTVQKGILCLCVVSKMQINHIIWVYVLMETDDGSYCFFLLASCCLFLLLLFISSHSPHFCLWATQTHLTLMCIYLKRHCNVTLMLLFPSLKPWKKTLLTVKCLFPFQTTRTQEWEKVMFLSDTCS